MSNPSPNATVGSVHQNRPVGAIPGKASAQQLQQQQQQRHQPTRKSGKTTPAAKTPTKKGKR